ncbi:MAG: AAA family ATPase [Halolamina sp.]
MYVLVCGPPGAGKTTIATRAQDRLTASGHPFRMLHSDDFASRTYPRMYERLEGSEADWLVDGTFQDREWQEQFRGLGEAYFVVVTASLETCLERNRARDTRERIEEEGVRVVHGEFRPPRDPALVLDTDDLTVEAAVDTLGNSVRAWL